MLIGVAIGDAFGAGYEFKYKKLDKFRDNLDFTRYQTTDYHNKGGHIPGMYTDDTQMSIAIAEVLLNFDFITKQNLANAFLKCYKRDPIHGYSRNSKQLLEQSVSVDSFLEKSNIGSSSKLSNGAAMRSVPLGILPKVNDVVNAAIINAETTHNNSKGKASSATIALLSHYSLYHGDISRFKTQGIHMVREIDIETAQHLVKIENAIKSRNQQDSKLLFGVEYETEGLPCNGMLTVGVVYYLLNKFQKPDRILKEAICMGGDTDSTAAITLGINLINNKLTDLPKFLFNDLINHDFGSDYILNLGEQLEKKYFDLKI